MIQGEGTEAAREFEAAEALLTRFQASPLTELDRRGMPSPVPEAPDVVCTPAVIRLPLEMRLDLGGTAKFWIAERAFTRMSGDGFINAGGDLITRRSAAFAVEIARPFGGLPLYLDCPAGTWGVATSSTLKRAWEGGHHLIDPARRARSNQTWFMSR